MSEVSALLANLCPRGVEFRPLGDVARLVRGNGMPKTDLTDSGVGAIHYGQIYTKYGVWTRTTLSFVAPETAKKLAKADPGDIIITNTSENIQDVGKAVAWLGDSQIVTGGHATIIKHTMDPKFLSYWFQSSAFSEQKKRLATGTKVIDVSAKQLAKVVVPVLPQEVQHAVVRMMDRFTDLGSQLQDLLLKERDARREQHAHYRNRLLGEIDSHVNVSLCEVADFFNARAHEKFVDPDGTVALLTSRFISTNGRMARYVKAADVLTAALEHDVALVMSDLPNGRALARTFFVDADRKYAANQRVCLLRARDHGTVLPRFLFHVLDRNPRLLAYDNGMDQTHLKKGYIQDLRIGLPPLAEQRRFVGLLDSLDALFGEIATAALPAELENRQKQYEYYRDNLFTFEELSA